LLTFRIDSPVAISTTRAPQAFRFVDPNQYSRPAQAQVYQRAPAAPCYGCAPPYYGPAVAPYYGPLVAPYPYWAPYWWPYYYGPGFGVVIGRGGFFGRRW
jgi:hypothetical protein